MAAAAALVVQEFLLQQSVWMFDSTQKFITRELPTIFEMAAKALKRAPVPTQPEGFLELTPSQWLQLAPVLACLAVAVIAPLSLIGAPRERADGCSVHSYWLTRVLLQRAMGLIYLCAFLTSSFQSRPLFGKTGLMPVNFGSSGRPTPVFSVLENGGWKFDDCQLELVSWIGVLLSLLQLGGVVHTCVLPAALWVCYLSIVNMGTLVINYGWEWLTLEAGFLLIFLTPLYSRSACPPDAPPNRLVLWLFRWLAFRLMIGAGMSKVGGNSSACWRELTCTQTHYFTQPMPNPLAWWAHHLPDEVHRLEVAVTFFEQLVLPFGVLLPIRSVRIGSALLECCFQLAIVGTGNYAWINWIGIVPYLALLDDGILRRVFPSKTIEAASDAGAANERRYAITTSKQGLWLEYLGNGISQMRWLLSKLITVLLVLNIALRSADPVKELFAASPWLHIYDDYFIVNSQGVFGFINSERVTLVLEFTHDTVTPAPPPPNTPPCVDGKMTPFTGPGAVPLSCSQLVRHCNDRQHGPAIMENCPASCGACSPRLQVVGGGDIDWKPLDFMNLPGSVDRRPSFTSPYHYRLDWEIWIHTTASFEGQEGPLHVPDFIAELVQQIMLGDTDAMSLVAPQVVGLLRDGKPPTACRAQFYRYTFSDPGQSDWWSREPLHGDKPKVMLPRSARTPDTVSARYRSPPHRSWMLLLSVCGTAIAMIAVQDAARTAPSWGKWKNPWVLLMSTQLIYCVATFCAVLFQDYPKLRASLGAPAAQIDAIGLRLSPDSWGDSSTGYATAFGLSAAQALGLLVLGLKLRAADSMKQHHPSTRDQKIDSILHGPEAREDRGGHGHRMDSHLLLSACLSGVMMVAAKNGGNFSAMLLQ